MADHSAGCEAGIRTMPRTYKRPPTGFADMASSRYEWLRKLSVRSIVWNAFSGEVSLDTLGELCQVIDVVQMLHEQARVDVEICVHQDVSQTDRRPLGVRRDPWYHAHLTIDQIAPPRSGGAGHPEDAPHRGGVEVAVHGLRPMLDSRPVVMADQHDAISQYPVGQGRTRRSRSPDRRLRPTSPSNRAADGGDLHSRRGERPRPHPSSVGRYRGPETRKGTPPRRPPAA